jgi:cellulose synthase/poly-beta-1,6-N-acetylglucosamine synthase-like glycosyltransferase
LITFALHIIEVTSDLTTFWLLCYGLLVLAAAGLLVYYLGVFSHLAFRRKRQPEAGATEPVSVVICARNEFFNLQANLESVLLQDYPEFEVVVVNDGSDDDSKDFLQDMMLIHKHLKVVNLPVSPNFFKGKKFPLSMGIKSATHDLLLLTDADCRPVSSLWIRNMQASCTSGREVVLGYGAYERKPGLLNTMIRFDTLHIAIQYLSYAIFGRPYMGVGRNLMYRKSLFNRLKGFSEHYTIPSGDDDLFINQAANRHNTTVALGEQAITLSKPKPSWAKWYEQKRRHLSTAQYYQQGDKIALGLYSFLQGLFYISLIISLLAGPQQYLPILVVWLWKSLWQTLIYGFAMQKLDKSRLYIFTIVLEPLMLLLNLAFWVSNRIGPRQEWK